MGSHTNIQWADTTTNPSTGCDGCELHIPGKGGPCYAGVLHESRLAKTLPTLYAERFTEVRLAPGRMAKAAALSDLTGKARPGKPWLDGQPRIIFIGDMSDVMSRDVPFDYLATEIIDVVRSPKGRRHIWMMLTKQASRLAKFAHWLGADRGIEWPENLRAGTSVTSRASLGRVLALLGMPEHATLFLSLEPLREWVDLTDINSGEYSVDCLGGKAIEKVHRGVIPTGRISQVIIGGESRQGRHDPHPFDIGWARKLIGQCRDAGAAAFVKQLGTAPYREEYSDLLRYTEVIPVDLKDSHGGDWLEWPQDIRVREIPKMEAASHVS